MVFSLVKEKAAPAPVIPKGRIIGVLSAKGGCGASTLAINISAALAEKAGSTILVDANLQNPDAALMLGKTAQFGLLDLVNGASEPTSEAVEACIVPLGPNKHNWSLLSPPLTGEAALKTQLSDVSRCIKEGREASHFWVVDLPNHLDRHLVTQLDVCDVIVLVFEETMPAVSAARRWWNTFSQLGYSHKHLFFVINRAGSRTGGAEARIKDLLPPECLRVPNCFSLCDDSVTEGAPPVISNPKHKFSQAVTTLTQKILEAMNEESYE